MKQTFLNFFSSKLSVLSLLFVFVLYSLPFNTKISEVIDNKRSCVCAYDGFGYYMYLPRLFHEGDLYFTHEWAQNVQNKYCEGVYAYQVEQGKYDRPLNIYHMGLAMVQLPAYLIGEMVARARGDSTNGFSKPYHVAFFLNAILFVLLGLIYFRKLLLLFFSDRITALTLLVLYTASNTFITFTEQYDLAHLYLFALNSIWLFHFFKFTQNKKRSNLIFAALFFGLTVCIRPTQALWGFIPFLVLYQEFKFSKLFWKQIVLFPSAALLWNLPQIAYWKIVGGSLLIMNMHTEDIVFSDPSVFDFLFSYRKGWLLYSPIFLLIFLGFYSLYKQNRKLFWPIFGFISIYIYTMSSWECWWFASSFGSRAMVETYPILAIVLAFLFKSLINWKTKLAIGIFICCTIVLNGLQSYQVNTYLLSTYRMSKQHYWYIFGKTSIEMYSEERLEINRSDLSWPEHYSSYGTPDGMELNEKIIYKQNRKLVADKNSFLSIVHLELLKRIPSDETLFEVSYKTKSSDSTKSSLLKFETVSPHNCYSWDSFEISKDFKQNEFVEHRHRFNLPYIRHNDDYMQIYIDNEYGESIELKDLKIKAYSITRE